VKFKKISKSSDENRAFRGVGENVRKKTLTRLALFGTFLLLVAVDIGSKFIATAVHSQIYNCGIAFSLFANVSAMQMVMLIGGIIVAAGSMAYLLISVNATLKQVEIGATLTTRQKLQRRFQNAGLLLFAAGALGNSLDRIWGLVDQARGQGCVTDFIYYPHLFTGNVADIFVVVGGITLVVSALLVK
jgi:signal peptidase II